MAVLKVARLGHPVLRRIADPVPPEAIASPEIQQLVDDLIEPMAAFAGAGLAAPQVHVSQQVVVFEVDDNPRYPQAGRVPLSVLINPHVTPTTLHMDEDWEGCLSVPDLRGKVPRYTSVRVEAYDRNGKKLHFVARDFHARVIQHECDHLQGHVFLDRMRSMESLSFLREFARYQGGAGGSSD